MLKLQYSRDGFAIWKDNKNTYRISILKGNNSFQFRLSRISSKWEYACVYCEQVYVTLMQKANCVINSLMVIPSFAVNFCQLVGKKCLFRISLENMQIIPQFSKNQAIIGLTTMFYGIKWLSTRKSYCFLTISVTI